MCNWVYILHMPASQVIYINFVRYDFRISLGCANITQPAQKVRFYIFFFYTFLLFSILFIDGPFGFASTEKMTNTTWNAGLSATLGRLQFTRSSACLLFIFRLFCRYLVSFFVFLSFFIIMWMGGTRLSGDMCVSNMIRADRNADSN